MNDGIAGIDSDAFEPTEKQFEDWNIENDHRDNEIEEDETKSKIFYSVYAELDAAIGIRFINKAVEEFMHLKPKAFECIITLQDETQITVCFDETGKPTS